MAGFKDIIKAERVDSLEKRQAAVETILHEQLSRMVDSLKLMAQVEHSIKLDVDKLNEGQETLYGEFKARTWGDRWRRLVAKLR